jgi:selenocysteine lyase/cysteine desulfurase
MKREKPLTAPAGVEPCDGQAGDCSHCGRIFAERFPLLERTINGRPLVYLDSAATTPNAERVVTK